MSEHEKETSEAASNGRLFSWRKLKEWFNHDTTTIPQCNEPLQTIEPSDGDTLATALMMLLAGKSPEEAAKALHKAVGRDEMMRIILYLHYIHSPQNFRNPPDKTPRGETVISTLEVTITGPQ